MTVKCREHFKGIDVPSCLINVGFFRTAFGRDHPVKDNKNIRADVHDLPFMENDLVTAAVSPTFIKDAAGIFGFAIGFEVYAG